MSCEFSPCSKKQRTGWKRKEKSSRIFLRTEKGMYFRVDSVDKVDNGLSAQKPLSASAYNTIIYLFLLIKRYNYRYAVICQHLAMVFLIFPNLSTLVNVCQRILFHKSNWYIGTYLLSTLSTPKCVHIIFYCSSCENKNTTYLSPLLIILIIKGCNVYVCRKKSGHS